MPDSTELNVPGFAAARDVVEKRKWANLRGMTGFLGGRKRLQKRSSEHDEGFRLQRHRGGPMKRSKFTDEQLWRDRQFNTRKRPESRTRRTPSTRRSGAA